MNKGLALSGAAITSAIEIALLLLGRPKATLLGASARQEVLRSLLAEPRIGAHLPELKRLKRGGQFFRKLDLAIQNGRMAFAHADEADVYGERLGVTPLRQEVRALANAFEAWMDAADLVDGPRALENAAAVLSRGEGVSRLPDEIAVFAAQKPESRERALWDAIAEHRPVRFFGPAFEARRGAPATLSWKWDRWHTLDDAAEALVAEIDAQRDVVLIPDSSDARRALKRALSQAGIPEADPRDPNRMRLEEAVKWALLPLQAVSSRFERARVLAYLRGYQMQSVFPAWCLEIAARGIREGLSGYAGGMLSGIHSRLNELEAELGGRKTCEELAEAHLRLLRMSAGTSEEEDAARAWVVPVFENIWKSFASDTRLIGQADRRAPLRYWIERLQSRVSEAPAPAERLKPREGVRVYRFHQAPPPGLEGVRRVWVFGLPSELAGAEVGDYWFSARDRERLGAEFAVRSSLQAREERIAALRAWLALAGEARVLDAEYAFDGRERELILPALREVAGEEAALSAAFPCAFPAEPREMGAHPRFRASFGAIRPLPPLRIELAPAAAGPDGITEISATALDRYSRCSFQSLAFDRWKLKDAREPDHELWPEVRGNILHEAVRILMGSRDSEGNFGVSARAALEDAWRSKRPKGLLKGARVAEQAKARLLRVLDAFCEKEAEYAKRSGTKIIALDDHRVALELGSVRVIGQPDRVDEHPDGIFIIDYKTSSALPHGTDMVELGYRLQLPFYALATSRTLNRDVLGVQFVELGRKASRSSGIFFKRHNGKEAGKLTNARANSKSLLSQEATEVWSRLEMQVETHARSFAAGKFEAFPKRGGKECQQCPVSDVCGFRRLMEERGDGEADA